MMVKASRTFTARGIALTTESDDHANPCWDGEEISRVEVLVPAGTLCDICGDPIGLPAEEEEEEGEK